MRIEIYPRPKNQAMAEDYCNGLQKAGDFYAYRASDETRWQRRAKRLDEANPPSLDRHQLADFLDQYNDKIANSSAAMRNIGRLREDGALVVVGGQQTGLFTGPLLVVYKAITLIQTAKYAEQILKRPVIPVFWMAGEDHDFAEVNHTFNLTVQPEIVRIKVDHPSGLRTSVSRTAIAEWEEALRQLDAALMPTEFKAALMEKLAEIGQRSDTLVDFFAHMFVWLFGQQGLVLLDSDDPRLRRLESPMFQLLLRKHREINEAFLLAKEKVEAAGYTAQTDLAPNNANLFVFSDREERILLQWDGAVFHDKKREHIFQQQELSAWAVATPERFSNNVMTRPLMQEYLFPVLATVLGPGEISYWGLTNDAFAALGMEMPIVVPRAEYTVVEGTIQKQLDKFGLSVDTVMNRFEPWKQQWLNAQDKLGLPARFAEVKRQFQQLYEPLLQAVSSINPGMSKLGAANAQKIAEQIDFLETRAMEANQAQFAAAIHQLEKIRLSLAPLGKPQERVYNIVSYLNKYGDTWIERLLELPYLSKGEHAIIYI